MRSSAAHDERESELSAPRQHLGELETKLKAEQSLRPRLEALGESERATARNNIANLEMKVQGLTSRLGVTEKLLNSTRDQLREKTEELKSAERTVREALSPRTTSSAGSRRCKPRSRRSRRSPRTRSARAPNSPTAARA